MDPYDGSPTPGRAAALPCAQICLLSIGGTGKIWRFDSFAENYSQDNEHPVKWCVHRSNTSETNLRFEGLEKFISRYEPICVGIHCFEDLVNRYVNCCQKAHSLDILSQGD